MGLVAVGCWMACSSRAVPEPLAAHAAEALTRRTRRRRDAALAPGRNVAALTSYVPRPGPIASTTGCDTDGNVASVSGDRQGPRRAYGARDHCRPGSTYRTYDEVRLGGHAVKMPVRPYLFFLGLAVAAGNTGRYFILPDDRQWGFDDLGSAGWEFLVSWVAVYAFAVWCVVASFRGGRR